MCKNHSHLIAELIGENTNHLNPVLIWELANTAVTIQTPGPDGSALILKTSGQLLMPSMMLGGYSQLPLPQMGEHSISLCLLPGDAMTIMQSALTLWNISVGHYPTT
jgi:hypothetical protein